MAGTSLIAFCSIHAQSSLRINAQAPADSAATSFVGDSTKTSRMQQTQQLGEVTVTGIVRKNSEEGRVKESQKSQVTENSVSSEEISKTQDNNAGEVIRRIPGVSIIDGQFVMVRGLSQRYNNVWINGAAVPSMEPDTRAFSFDILPSSQIDKLTIIKTPSAEYPADYSGGFIMVDTKEIPISNNFKISLGFCDRLAWIRQRAALPATWHPYHTQYHWRQRHRPRQQPFQQRLARQILHAVGQSERIPGVGPSLPPVWLTFGNACHSQLFQRIHHLYGHAKQSLRCLRY